MLLFGCIFLLTFWQRPLCHIKTDGLWCTGVKATELGSRILHPASAVKFAAWTWVRHKVKPSEACNISGCSLHTADLSCRSVPRAAPEVTGGGRGLHREALWMQFCQAAHPEMGVLSTEVALGYSDLLSHVTEVVCLIQQLPTDWALFVGVTKTVGIELSLIQSKMRCKIWTTTAQSRKGLLNFISSKHSTA